MAPHSNFKSKPTWHYRHLLLSIISREPWISLNFNLWSRLYYSIRFAHICVESFYHLFMFMIVRFMSMKLAFITSEFLLHAHKEIILRMYINRFVGLVFVAFSCESFFFQSFVWHKINSWTIPSINEFIWKNSAHTKLNHIWNVSQNIIRWNKCVHFVNNELHWIQSPNKYKTFHPNISW